MLTELRFKEVTRSLLFILVGTMLLTPIDSCALINHVSNSGVDNKNNISDSRWPRSIIRPQIDLDGEWEFRIDPNDVSQQERWFDASIPFEETILVPGAWDAQGIGEATAFGALAIIDRIEESGVRLDEVVNCSGLAIKNSMLMQIYADITNKPMKVSRSEQTPALGAVIFGAVTAGKNAGGYADVETAQEKMTGTNKLYIPNPENHKVYKKLYKLYRQLHDGFGLKDQNISMYNAMKDLLDMRDKVRRNL